jgi:hypothetical protein
MSWHERELCWIVVFGSQLLIPYRQLHAFYCSTKLLSFNNRCLIEVIKWNRMGQGCRWSLWARREMHKKFRWETKGCTWLARHKYRMASNTVRSESRCALRVRYVAKSAVYRDRPRTLNALKTAITAFIRNLSQADLQEVFSNKIKRVQAGIDTQGSHFQHHF